MKHSGKAVRVTETLFAGGHTANWSRCHPGGSQSGKCWVIIPGGRRKGGGKKRRKKGREKDKEIGPFDPNPQFPRLSVKLREW